MSFWLAHSSNESDLGEIIDTLRKKTYCGTWAYRIRDVWPEMSAIPPHIAATLGGQTTFLMKNTMMGLWCMTLIIRRSVTGQQAAATAKNSCNRDRPVFMNETSD